MRKSVHSRLSEIFREHLRGLRQKAGLTQRDLAALLEREHALVARIELGERRVDFVEAFELFKALKCDPVEEACILMRKFGDSA